MVMLVSWLEAKAWECPEPIEMLELFSGRARCSKMAALSGLSVRSIDIDYDKPRKKKSKHSGKQKRSAMDVNGEAGFTFRGYCMLTPFFSDEITTEP